MGCVLNEQVWLWRKIEAPVEERWQRADAARSAKILASITAQRFLIKDSYHVALKYAVTGATSVETGWNKLISDIQQRVVALPQGSLKSLTPNIRARSIGTSEYIESKTVEFFVPHISISNRILEQSIVLISPVSFGKSIT